MNVSLYQAAAALDATSRWQEVIAENLAASSVPGFKKQEVSFGTIQAGLQIGAQGLREPSTLPVSRTTINFSQAELHFTGSPSHVAIEGPGFFAAQLPDGREAFTRDGEFHIDTFGQLTTKQGYPVLGTGGPITLDLNNTAALSISSSGEVAQGADAIGQLQLSDFNDPRLLTPASGGFFLAVNRNLQMVDPENTSVRQGYLEGSNASSVTEMTQLITALRAYEANQRVVQVQDERTSRLITELGNPG